MFPILAFACSCIDRFRFRHGFGKYTTARGMCHIGEWSEGLREGRAIQRSVIKLASGSIARDYFLEFAGTYLVLAILAIVLL